MKKGLYNLIVLLVFVFYQIPSYSNEVYDLLMSYDFPERKSLFNKLLKMSRNECDEVVHDYFQGVINDKSFWSVKCSNGNEWSLRFPDDFDDQIEVRNCRYFNEQGLECFKKLETVADIDQMKPDSCNQKKHVSVKSGILTDRCGLISITKPSYFLDATESYIKSVKNYNQGLDEGIILLLNLKSETGSPSCSFRQLRYFPNEGGYSFTAEDLANVLMDSNLKTMSKNHTSDLLNRGYNVPVSITPPPDKHKVLINRSSEDYNYQAWEIAYEMWNAKETSGFNIGYKYFTTVIKLPTHLRRGNANYFIVADCGYTDSRANISNRDHVIKELMKSINILENNS